MRINFDLLFLVQYKYADARIYVHHLAYRGIRSRRPGSSGIQVEARCQRYNTRSGPEPGRNKGNLDLLLAHGVDLGPYIQSPGRI